MIVKIAVGCELTGEAKRSHDRAGGGWIARKRHETPCKAFAHRTKTSSKGEGKGVTETNDRQEFLLTLAIVVLPVVEVEVAVVVVQLQPGEVVAIVVERDEQRLIVVVLNGVVDVLAGEIDAEVDQRSMFARFGARMCFDAFDRVVVVRGPLAGAPRAFAIRCVLLVAIAAACQSIAAVRRRADRRP